MTSNAREPIMFMRLLDTLLPAAVLVALVFAMATAFGALQPKPQPRLVKLERVVVSAERTPAAVAAASEAAATRLR
jgi:hypothetical protein